MGGQQVKVSYLPFCSKVWYCFVKQLQLVLKRNEDTNNSRALQVLLRKICVTYPNSLGTSSKIANTFG